MVQDFHIENHRFGFTLGPFAAVVTLVILGQTVLFCSKPNQVLFLPKLQPHDKGQVHVMLCCVGNDDIGLL